MRNQAMYVWQERSRGEEPELKPFICSAIFLWRKKLSKQNLTQSHFLNIVFNNFYFLSSREQGVIFYCLNSNLLKVNLLEILNTMIFFRIKNVNYLEPAIMSFLELKSRKVWTALRLLN